MVHVSFLSFDFGVGLVVFWTFTLELYEPIDFLDTLGDGIETVASCVDFLAESVTFDDGPGVDPLDFVGVSSVFKILTLPFVNCSALMTSAGKLVIILLLERYLSESFFVL